MAEEIFDIVNEADEIIGTETRSNAHAKGLRHRAVHVLFMTPAREIILQRRSMTKDTWPGFLTVTVGGHVPSGSTYDETVLTEIFEETGLRLQRDALQHIGDLRYEARDPQTKAHDCENVRVYVHIYDGDISDLRIEEKDGAGFETRPIETLLAMSPEEQAQSNIVPVLFSAEHYRPLYPKIQALI